MLGRYLSIMELRYLCLGVELVLIYLRPGETFGIHSANTFRKYSNREIDRERERAKERIYPAENNYELNDSIIKSNNG